MLTKINLLIFISMLFSLQLLYWIIGKRDLKKVANTQDYFLAGKNVNFFPLMMTFLATQIGGGLVLGAADEAYLFGWPVLFYPLGASFGLLLLGSGIGRRLAQFKVATIAQIFEVAYHSVMLKKIASALSIMSLFMILVAQIITSNKFLISLGINNQIFFIIFWAVIIIYTVQGGLKAVISIDTIQAGFFSIIFLFCFGFVLYSHPSFIFTPTSTMQDLAPVSSKLCGWLLMPLLFMVIEQDMGQRCFAGHSSKIVSKASFIAGIATMIVCIVPVFFGSLAQTMQLEVPQGGSVLMAVIAKTTTPWITTIVGCAILVAIISTATSLINAISSNLSSDFKLTHQNKHTVRIVQAFTSIISITAILFAFYFDNTVSLLIQSYELSVSCLFIPIFIALFKKQANFISALLSIVFGALGFFTFRLISMEFPQELCSVSLSLLGYLVGEGFVVYQNRNKTPLKL